MKKRIFFYALLLCVVSGFAFFNLNYQADIKNLNTVSVINDNGIITLKGEISGKNKTFHSVKTEKTGNICFVSVYVNNSIKSSKTTFEVSVSNKNNEIKEIKFIKKDKEKTAFINKDYGKLTFFENTAIS